MKTRTETEIMKTQKTLGGATIEYVGPYQRCSNASEWRIVEECEERPHTVAILENQLNLYKEALKKTVEERDELLDTLEKLTASLNQFIENHSIGRSVIADCGLLGLIGEAESIIAQIKDKE